MLGDAMVRGARAVRWVLQRLLIIVIVLGGYLGVTAVQVWLTSRHDDPRPVQAIVVMGAAQYDGVPSPDLVSRLQDAQRLWGKDANQIVVTGSKQAGDTYTEAEASAAWLTQHGVPADDIIQVGGNDTWASLSLAATALHKQGEDKVLIATDGFHEDRCLAIASSLGLQAWPVPATGSPISGLSSVPYFAKETVGVGLGRVVGYSRLHALG
ncbi:MAG: YdcF family protein [Acidimicrobiales bacterium]|jgi:vancomycin permeability regulator SanA